MSNEWPIPGATRVTEQARLALSQLPADASLDDVFNRACEVAANALDIERVGVWLFVDNRSALRCATLYERSKNEFSSGSILQVADFPRYFEALTIRKAIPAEVAAIDPGTAELASAYLDPLGISSMLDAGIFIEANLVGVVCHENIGPPREWTTEARDFAGSVADLLAVRIQSAKVYELSAAFRTQKDHLIALEKAQMVAQIAAGVAHDFANLLTIIGGNAELIQMDITVPKAAREQAKDISQAVERGQSMLQELRDFARPKQRQPIVLDLAAVTEEFLPLLRGAVGKAHEVEFVPSGSLGRVLLDKTQFTRVLLNLTVNARDAMPDGGKVKISLYPTKYAIGEEPPGHYVVLDVADTGVGMDENTCKRAFEPFYTTKKEGTGLGLAIVSRIADQAGGLVRIESTPGKGTAIRVYFPRVGASNGGTAQPPSGGAAG